KNVLYKQLTDEFYCLREKAGKVLSDVIGNWYLHVLDMSLFFESVRQVRPIPSLLNWSRCQGTGRYRTGAVHVRQTVDVRTSRALRRRAEHGEQLVLASCVPGMWHKRRCDVQRPQTHQGVRVTDETCHVVVSSGTTFQKRLTPFWIRLLSSCLFSDPSVHRCIIYMKRLQCFNLLLLIKSSSNKLCPKLVVYGFIE
ncbi:hypothetical protein AGLY_008493, partial [Aphis glycines]